MKRRTAMGMPVDLVLLRHGESDGNRANAKSRRGDDSDFTEEFLACHSSEWRLTEKGRQQAVIAGQWIMENIGSEFDRYYVSEYIRAMETAALANLPNPEWFVDFNLRERDWGALDVMTDAGRKERFKQDLDRRDINRFFWRPPRGEAMSDLCLRIDRMIGTIYRECQEKRVIIVCHGEVMWAFRMRLERILQVDYKILEESTHPFDHMHNCQVLHYTRRHPETGNITKYLDWMRSVCPTDTRLSRNEWQKIERKTFTNQGLLEHVSKFPHRT